MTTGICIAACAGGGSTMRLYDMERGKPLPPEKIARVALNDMKGYGYRLMMRFDTRDSLLPKDTIEVLPGGHGIQLHVRTADRTMPIERYDQRAARSHSCIYFEFVARAGHVYEFRIIDFTFGDWKIDLVDLSDTTRVIHGSGCRRDQWWIKMHEEES
jgi:hypothetical protein